ncbi:MAG: Arm DNA-binding domain-containing protein [Rubrivivax sp.]
MMSKRTIGLHLLAARKVLAAPPGEHSDGGGVTLRVTEKSAWWVLRFTSPSGRRRRIGLGVCRRDSLAVIGESMSAAREEAQKARALLQYDIDPIDAWEQRREAIRAAEVTAEAKQARQRWTLARAARDYHERVIEPGTGQPDVIEACLAHEESNRVG